jgi:uncharacterized protein YjiS (DUF1127 family)
LDGLRTSAQILKPANAALHNAHCCHAGSALLNRLNETYFSRREEKRSTKDEVSKTMNLIRNYRNWRRYRETVSELSRLSNRELSDLGFARGDIREVARKAI